MATLSKPERKRTASSKIESAQHLAMSMGKANVPNNFGIGVPAPLKGARAKRAVRESGVVDAKGTLKSRFR